MARVSTMPAYLKNYHYGEVIQEDGPYKGMVRQGNGAITLEAYADMVRRRGVTKRENKAKKLAEAERRSAGERAIAELAAIQAALPMDEKERLGLGLGSPKKAVEWVWRHLNDAGVHADVPSHVKALWEYYHTHPGAFFETYMPILVKVEIDSGAGESARREQQSREDLEASLKRLDDWWAERQKAVLEPQAANGVQQGHPEVQMPATTSPTIAPGEPPFPHNLRPELAEMPPWVKQDEGKEHVLKAGDCPGCGMPMQFCMCGSKQEFFAR